MQRLPRPLFSNMHSLLQYGIIYWGQASIGQVERIFRIQKRAIRVLNGLKSYESCKNYFIEDRILTFPSIFILNIVTFVKNNPHLYTPHLSSHKYQTRQPNKLNSIYHKKSFYEKSVLYAGIHYFNKIPDCIKTMKDNKKFSSLVKQFLCKKGYYSLKEF